MNSRRPGITEGRHTGVAVITYPTAHPI